MRWWILMSVLVLLVSPGVSRAQTAKPAPQPAANAELKIQFETALHATVTAIGLAGQVCATDSAMAKDCAACSGSMCPEACSNPKLVYRVDRHGGVGAGLVSSVSTNEASTWIRTLLTREKVSCADNAGKLTAASVSVAIPPVIQLDGGVSPDAKLPGVFVWTGWERPHLARLVSQILPADLSKVKCSISTPANRTKPIVCNLVRSPLDGGVRLLFNHSEASLSSGTITVDVPATKTKLRAEIFVCDFQVTDRWGGALFAGALLQRIELASTPDCTTRLTGNTVRLANGSIAIAASELRSGVGGSATLVLNNIPASIPDGAWQLEATSGTRLGSLSLDVVHTPLKVKSDASSNPALDIHYRVDTPNTELNQWHDGQSVEGQAVVTAAQGDYEQFVQNTATIEVADRLKNLAKRLTPSRYTPAQCGGGKSSCKVEDPTECADMSLYECSDLEQRVEACGAHAVEKENLARLEACRSMLRPWRVSSKSWQQDAWVHEDGWWYRTPVPTPARSEDLGQVTFAVFAPQRQPYSVMVELVDRSGSGAGPGSETEADVVFRSQVVLARSARYESLPLPLARALHVECGDQARKHGLFRSDPPVTDDTLDVVTDGRTRAVNDEDVTTGNCRLVYSYQRVLRALGLDDSEASRDVLKYYGRQELTLKVRRGQTERETVWSLDPTSDTVVRLPVPEEAKNATGIYTVVASLRGRLPPAVVYRPGASTVQTATSSALGELEFKANLRPRGPFGWKVAPIRAFMTFPVNFTGLRFSARPKELDSSSASSNVQITEVQMGAVLAVEPWNYDKGRNLWPVPVRFMTGAHLYNLTEATVAPSWITGAALTFPILDLQKGVTEDQLGTDVALGLFWEVDVAEQDWLTTGHHFLLTLGVNLLSLFGAR